MEQYTSNLILNEDIEPKKIEFPYERFLELQDDIPTFLKEVGEHNQKHNKEWLKWSTIKYHKMMQERAIRTGVPNTTRETLKSARCQSLT